MAPRPHTAPLPWRTGSSVEGWTVPRILQARAEIEPGRVLFREKWLGIYHSYTYADTWREVAAIARGLMELGVQPGDRVAIMGDPCREYLLCELAVWTAGAMSVGIYPTSAPAEVLYQMQDSGSTIFIAEDQEHLDKLLAIKDSLPDVRAIVVMDTRAVFLYEENTLIPLERLTARGRDLATHDETKLDALVADLDVDSPLCLVYTSGTTGNPKGAVHSHRSFLYATLSWLLSDRLRVREERMVAHLPLAHVVGKGVTVTLPLLTQLVPHFPEHVEMFTESNYEVAPTFLALPPRFYEKFAAQMVVAVDSSTWLKRRLYHLSMAIGRAAVTGRWRTGRIPVHLMVPYRLARSIVFVPLLRQVGFHKLRYAMAGSAAVPPEIATLWQVWGIDLRIIYGLTESGGLITAQHHDFPEPTDVGELINLPGWEMKISTDGELLFRGPENFVEYWNKPGPTAETLVDGWLQTGDVVTVDDQGRVKLIDRKKDIIITSGGKSLSPQQIENEIKASPYITEVTAIADGRKYVTALIELDEATVSEWARARHIPYGSFPDLVNRREVHALIEQEVATANERLSRVEQVKKFCLIPFELDPEQGEVTPTRKVKRRLMTQMFGQDIERMYREERTVQMVTLVQEKV